MKVRFDWKRGDIVAFDVVVTPLDLVRCKAETGATDLVTTNGCLKGIYDIKEDTISVGTAVYMPDPKGINLVSDHFHRLLKDDIAGMLAGLQAKQELWDDEACRAHADKRGWLLFENMSPDVLHEIKVRMGLEEPDEDPAPAAYAPGR